MGRAFEFRKERKFKRWAGMAKTFSRISKDIIMDVKEGGDNPASNNRLRLSLKNTNICPAVFEIFESLKQQF